MVLAKNKLTPIGALILGILIMGFFSTLIIFNYATKNVVAYEFSLLDENGQPDDYFDGDAEIYVFPKDDVALGHGAGVVKYNITEGIVDVSIFEFSDSEVPLISFSLADGEEITVNYRTEYMERDYVLTLSISQRKIIRNEYFWLDVGGLVIVLAGLLGLLADKLEKKKNL